MGYPHLNDLTEEEKLERKKQQKRDAQKRYYAKNKDKYREYGNTYYMDMKKDNALLKDTLKGIKDYIISIPNYKHLSYFIDIIERIDGVINE